MVLLGYLWDSWGTAKTLSSDNFSHQLSQCLTRPARRDTQARAYFPESPTNPQIPTVFARARMQYALFWLLFTRCATPSLYSSSDILYKAAGNAVRRDGDVAESRTCSSSVTSGGIFHVPLMYAQGIGMFEVVIQGCGLEWYKTMPACLFLLSFFYQDASSRRFSSYLYYFLKNSLFLYD